MSLTIDDVKRIALLARIEISASEAEQTLKQLAEIFHLIEEMNAVDVGGIEPMSHAQSTSLRLRDDVVTEVDQRTSFQAIAPQVEAGLYLVPKVIE